MMVQMGKIFFGSFVIIKFICMVNDVQQPAAQYQKHNIPPTNNWIRIHNANYGITAVQNSIQTHFSISPCNNQLWIIDICINAHTNAIVSARNFSASIWFSDKMKGVWNIHWIECITTALHLWYPEIWPFKNDIERLTIRHESQILDGYICSFSSLK